MTIIPNILAVDPSLTATGYSVFDKNKECITHGVIKTKHTDTESDVKRIETIRSAIEEIINRFNVGYVVMEGYSYGSIGRAVFTLGELSGVLKNYLHRTNIKYTIVQPTTIKKWLTGTGTAKKELIMLKVYKKWGIEFSDNNVADAYAIGKYACDVLVGDNK